MSDPERQTHILIALNAAEDVPRESICRLSSQLSVWVHLSPRGDLIGQALQLGVPGEHLKAALRLIPSAKDRAHRELERAEEANATIMTFFDHDYPEPLRDLTLPPPVLYCRGSYPSRPAIAIVGARRADPMGLDVAELFGRELAVRGLTVVSGFARGVDTAAHRGALEATNGRTVAVLGCGIDVEYPRRRQRFTHRLVSSGAAFSEFPMGTPPLPYNFPIRNRIIAALALGTLVVRATRRSGSLITARLAMELGRDVYAVPGGLIDKLAVGPNNLIRDGAMIALHPRDIVESLPYTVQQRLEPAAEPCDSPEPPVGGTLGKVLQVLTPGELLGAEKVATLAELPVDRVLGHLLELELGGWIRRFPGPAYQRKL